MINSMRLLAIALIAALNCAIACAQTAVAYRCGTSNGVVVSQVPCKSTGPANTQKITVSGYGVPSNPHKVPTRIVSGKVTTEEGVPLQDLPKSPEASPMLFQPGVRAPS